MPVVVFLVRALYRDFEKALNEALGHQLRASDLLASEMWSALANVSWHSVDDEYQIPVMYTFREAGALIAAITEQGDYLTWYMSGPYSTVAPWIAEAMLGRGWTFKLMSD